MGRSIPLEVEAGTSVTLNVGVSCPSGCDLRGLSVSVMAPDGVVMTSELVDYGEQMNETGEFALTVPKQVGEHAWSVLFPRHEIGTVVHEECALPISFQTIPHRTSMAVWDVPFPVAKNRSFKVKVGLQCSAACQLTGQVVEIRDEAGTKVGEGRLGDTLWAGTSALYWAEVDMAAPAAEGVSSSSVTFTAAELEVAHEDASASFSFRADRPPDHTVTVRVIDKQTKAPIDDVEVRLGLYMVSTDERGVVKVGLPQGTYELTIRKDGYKADPMSVEMSEDLTVQIEALTAPTRLEREEQLMKFEDYPWG
jgi:hypothetical protein